MEHVFQIPRGHALACECGSLCQEVHKTVLRLLRNLALSLSQRDEGFGEGECEEKARRRQPGAETVSKDLESGMGVKLAANLVGSASQMMRWA